MSNDNRIISIISEQSIVDGKEIKKEDLLVELGIDSLRIVELIVSLEEQLGIRFDDSELELAKLSSVEQVIELTNKYLKG